MKKNLKDFPIIRVSEGEEILCVQRQHPIVLFNQMFLLSILLLLIPITILLTTFSLSDIFPNILNQPVLISYIMLAALSAFLISELYVFMNWYYQFYIITNKAIIHRQSFRIFGPFSESVYGENMHIQDIARSSPNIIYDLLKIQDVYVYFHKLEREEPFIFRTPQDAQVIDDLLQDLIIQSAHKKESQII